MADKLIFPIGFDLEAGVKEAQGDLDKALRRFEASIREKPLTVQVSGISELQQGIKSLTESLIRLNTVFAASANMQQQLSTATQEHGRITANTSNTASRQLMEQERINKSLRDVYNEQERVNKLLAQYHDTYDGQIESLIRLNNALEVNKQAQKDNEKALKDRSITSAQFYAKQTELTAQYRQLTQEKRVLTQIMTAEEKAMIAQEGSYVQLSQQLSLLKKAYKDLGEEGRISAFGQDLEGAIQNLDAHLKDMAADMGEFQRNVGNYAIAGQNGVVATESLTAAINQEARTTQDLIDQTRILEEAKRMINKEDANYQTTLAALNAKLDENRRKLADVSDILGKEAKSVAEAEAQNKRLSEAIKQIDLSSADAKKQLEAMRNQIERNNKTISAATGVNERYADSVLGLVGINANFGRSLQGLAQGGSLMDGLKIKAQALGKTLLGLISNPYVLALIGVAGVAAGFKWWYDYNKGLIEASRLTENFTGLSGEAADKVTADMQALADHMGQGYDKTISAANALVQQFGISWEKAMKLMQDGIVAGADMSGNMVSNIERFAPALRDAGVSADEFMSILAETRNGIFNEQGIQLIVRAGGRLKAMTKQMAESLDAAGISSKQLQKDLSDGTMTMFDAVQKVATKLKELPENSQEAGNIMKHVFSGTAAEGGTLLIQSIADVNTNLEEAKKRMAELGEANEAQLNAQRELNEALSAVFKMSGTTFEVMMINAKTFVLEGLTKIIRGCVDIVNWFIRMYNGSIAVRGGVSSIVNSFQTLWEISKFVVNQIIDSFTAAGTILEGVVTLDWNKVKQGYSDGMKALGRNITTLAENIASNTANAFQNTLNGEMKEFSVKLNADGTDSTGNNQNKVNPEKIQPIGEVDKEAAKTYLQTLNKIEQSITAINAKYNELAKKEGNTKALEHINELYKTQLDYINELGEQFGLSFKMPTSFKDLQDYRTAILDVINKLRASGLKGANAAALELEMKIGTGNIDNAQKQIESELKRLSDRISRTKTAKEFYEKILSQTGDVELAANLSLSIYGENGEDLDKAIRDNIQATLGKDKKGIDLDFSAAIRADGSVDYNALEKIAKGYLDVGDISEDTYNQILKMRDEDRKDLAKTVEGWLKATEKAKSYSDKLLDLRRKTQTEIDRINKEEARGRITPEVADSQRSGFLRKEAEEIAKLQYEAFKDSPMYVQMFDDLDNASGTMLRNMKKRIEELKTSWKDLTPTQLKEMQSRLNEIDAQLAKRNPFKGLIDGIKKYRNLRKGGDDGLGPKSERAAEKTLDTAAKARLEAEKEYLEILQKEGATQQEITDAKRRFDDAAADEDAAAKALENWKKVKDAIGLSANELFQMLNWAGDIAKGIADISEAMGADEEDVQYWNDVADALGQISGGIQDIVSAAMSGNVVGIISSTLTAIPKMFVGFANLFSAGKIKKANKEIKRQQELLDQLEYTYGRLEKAADKLFGADYLNNYNQQLKVLQAQQTAYLKQAEAERSKGKKADKDKIKEYENQARETADAIKELQDDLVAQIVGTDVASAARDFANAWLDAYLSFGSTTDAIKEKFDDMIKNMIVNMVLAQVVKRALEPIFKMIDDLAADGELSANDIAKVFAMVPQSMQDINNGLSVGVEALKAAGVDISKLRDGSSEFSGIAKNIAGATSEEINTAAAIGNTIMYHTSHLPIISQNVAAMYQLMSQGKTAAIDSGSTGWTDWQQQAMDNYNAIARNTADTVVECRRAAVACEAATEKLNRIIVAKGGKFAVNTTYV